jgi:hypothetical protein
MSRQRLELAPSIERRITLSLIRLRGLCGRILLHAGETIFSRKHALVQCTGFLNKASFVTVGVRLRESYDFAHLISMERCARRKSKSEYRASLRGVLRTTVLNRRITVPVHLTDVSTNASLVRGRCLRRLRRIPARTDDTHQPIISRNERTAAVKSQCGDQQCAGKICQSEPEKRCA